MPGYAAAAFDAPRFAKPLMYADYRASAQPLGGGEFDVVAVGRCAVPARLPLSSTATSATCWALWRERSAPLRKYWRRRPLVFSLLPRYQGLAGSQKQTGMLVAIVK
jgi:hypothetical protein